MLTTVLFGIFLLALGYQCVVYICLARRLLAYAPPPTPNVPSEGVTVIVCAHNERKNLEVLLPLLLRQTGIPYEIIVADDVSDDGTAAFLNKQQQRHPRLRVVRIAQRPPHIQPKKHALTQAIRAAHYDKLLLTDADCRPMSAHWLRRMSEPLHAPTQFVLGYSPYYSQPGLLNAFIRYETLHTGFLYTSAALAGRPYMGVGRNLAYRRLFFLDSDGFRDHETVVGGDDDLWVNQQANAQNVAVVLAKDALVYSVPKTSWRGYLQQKMRHLHVGQRYRASNKAWLGLLSLSTMAVWIAGGVLVVICNKCHPIVALFLLRWLILAAVLGIARRRLHDPINLWLLPILDFLHVIYYGVVGTLAFSTKNIRWTN